jgi:hypothetical protein
MGLLVLGILFLALYITVTWIFWRNVPLTGFCKALFCLTIFPLFLVLMVVNVLLTDRYAPLLVDLFGAADGDPEALIAFLISTPLPVALSFVWYKLISWFDTGTRDERPDR